MPEEVSGPIPIEAYECPKCGLKKIWTKEEAKAHYDMPTDTLPRGLVYIHLGLDEETKGKTCFEVVVSKWKRPPAKEDHNCRYRVRQIIESTDLRGYIQGVARDFERGLSRERGDYRFLTSEEFERFKEEYGEELKRDCGITELVQSTPQLEALVEAA